MNVLQEYVIYELNQVMGSKKHLALEEIVFDDFYLSNRFNSEEEAVQALVNAKLTHCEYVILKRVYIN